MRGPKGLWVLLGAALTATVTKATIGSTAVWWFTDAHSWPATAAWLVRNTANISRSSAKAERRRPACKETQVAAAVSNLDNRRGSRGSAKW